MLIKYYGNIRNRNLIIKLLEFVIQNTDFYEPALWDRTTLKIIEENKIDNDFVIKV